MKTRLLGALLLAILFAVPAKAQDSELVPGSFIANSTTGTTGATAAAIPAFPNQWSYLCGFSVDATATAAIAVTSTVATVGNTTAGVTLTFEQGVGASPVVISLNRTFYPCLRSNNQNTAITVTSGAAGAGGATTVNVWGYSR